MTLDLDDHFRLQRVTDHGTQSVESKIIYDEFWGCHSYIRTASYLLLYGGSIQTVSDLRTVRCQKAHQGIPRRTILRHSDNACTAVIILAKAHFLRHALNREVEIVHYRLK